MAHLPQRLRDVMAGEIGATQNLAQIIGKLSDRPLPIPERLGTLVGHVSGAVTVCLVLGGWVIKQTLPERSVR
ncbi:hypothetical protein D3C77_397120 [compost metagenome]